MDTEEVGRYWDANAAAWTELSRAGYDVYRDVLNTPAFLELLPQVEGLTGLDIGCGEGTNTRKVAERGAEMIAIDIAPTFIAAAREVEQLAPCGIEFHVGDATAIPFQARSFDFATAFMSLMDVADQRKALQEAFRVLRPGGFLQFSILHPCFVPPRRRNLRAEDGATYAIEVAEYFRRTNGELETWTFGSAPEEVRAKTRPFIVPRFHRTLGDWVGMLVGAGFSIEAIGEPMATNDMAEQHPEVQDTQVTPLFLHVRVRKSR